ncbi:hypothetical protein E1264_20870 [Actinomadura sp. KC216]|uniref:hypothetical protein n=1 Tax=Actinomadura sp. KC216 TaxID=2530370 RepID=UPI001047F7D2|nr:hypothetical protein [Actinomadura sp. KC216]TDB85529.1 hypothetical protein E1264_20870 [Actinomadura sp. KC216]
MSAETVIGRVAETARRLVGYWERNPGGVRLPGWHAPFRPLGDLLPARDVEFAERNPQMVPLLWYPALSTGPDTRRVIDVLDHLPVDHDAASAMIRRQELSRIYSWAIASRTALDWLGDRLAGRGLLEVGAGSGYWASLLRAQGADVLATDSATDRNGYTDRFRFTDVQAATAAEAARCHPDRVLAVIWPPHREPMAAEALAAYQGSGLVYIGGRRGGLCAERSFFDALAEHWRPVSRCPLTLRWLGYDDQATFYVRRAS